MKKWLQREKWQKKKQYVTQHWREILGISATVVLTFAFVFAAYKFKWDWTGITDVQSKRTTVSTSEGFITVTEVQLSKTLWDWLQVLAIPAVVGLGAAWYTVQQGKARDAGIKDNQNEAALQGYLDKMSELLLEKKIACLGRK